MHHVNIPIYSRQCNGQGLRLNVIQQILLTQSDLWMESPAETAVSQHGKSLCPESRQEF